MKQPYNTTIYNTALYMRLSRDDESYGDSVSIETQRTILQQYAKEQGLHVVGEYVDDGWSGTNFERPSFQRMMDDVEAGKVNCIVTKDLSRFGREHVMMDYYLEFLFPEKRVRYIAVAENEDTEKGLSDFVPFKNLFNEWFAKDTSRKVKTAFKAKFAAGQRISAYAPLGYKKHPEIKNKLIIDEETRWIVEKIFDLAIHGKGAASITRILIAEKVPTPGFINFQRDGTFANIYAGAPEEKGYAWTIAQVKSIMKDETYIGHTIHYRETNISFKNKRRIRKPQSEWVRVENTQEPIISEQVFRQVQEQIASRRRERKNGTTQIFAGLIKCADCGWSLAYGENRQNSKPYGYYHCSKNGQGTRQCSMHYIRYDVLYAYVLSRLQYWSALVQHDEEQLLKRLLNANDKGQAAARKKQAAELKKAEKRKAEVDTLFARMYEDWAAGRITEYNFNMLSGKYQRKSEENIIGVATDSKHKQRRLKAVICALLIISILAVSVIGAALYRANKPMNFIAPVSEDSVEMQTVKLLAGSDGANVYKFTTTDEYNRLNIYISEYQAGELVNKERMGIGFEGIGSPKNGEIIIVPDYEHAVIKLVISTDEGSKFSTELPIMEGVEDKEYYGRSQSRIEGETKILYDIEQPLVGMIYDNDEMYVIDLYDLLSGETDSLSKNDYMYLFSYEFCKE